MDIHYIIGIGWLLQFVLIVYILLHMPPRRNAKSTTKEPPVFVLHTTVSNTSVPEEKYKAELDSLVRNYGLHGSPWMSFRYYLNVCTGRETNLIHLYPPASGDFVKAKREALDAYYSHRIFSAK